jgi:phosphomannomutase
MVKDKIDLDKVDKDTVMKQALNIFKDANVNKIDGLKLSWDDRWIHLRGSNTEPILRIYAEAPTKSDAQLLVDRIRALI